MTELDGRVAIVTGAGRGLGRAHALMLAERGVRVVVNDAGTGTDGRGTDHTVAQEVVDEIVAAGGQATADSESVSDWNGACRLVDTAVSTYGGLDILVNNAGILRDRMLVNMSEAEFDAVIDVHVKGTFCTTRHAANYWRDMAKKGAPRAASVVNTSSGAGLFNNVGQANYSAAKSAIVTFGQVAAKELARYGVRVNVIAPMARTRLVQQTPGLNELTASESTSDFDPWAPENVSPLVTYLAAADCPYTGGIWHVFAGRIDLVGGYTFTQTFERSPRWTVDALAEELTTADLAKSQDGLLSEALNMYEVIHEVTTGITRGAPGQAVTWSQQP